jgi:hypothetical protein
VYEAVSMHAHERAANSFLRAQAIVDTVTAGKMAAAAASAAALAGGGVAVEGVLSAAPVTPQALVRRVDNGASTAFAKHSVQHAKTRTHARPISHAHASTPRHHDKPPGSAAASVRASVTTTQQASAPPPATTPRASAASAGSPHNSGGSASSEFGFEGP